MCNERQQYRKWLETLPTNPHLHLSAGFGSPNSIIPETKRLIFSHAYGLTDSTRCWTFLWMCPVQYVYRSLAQLSGLFSMKFKVRGSWGGTLKQLQGAFHLNRYDLHNQTKHRWEFFQMSVPGLTPSERTWFHSWHADEKSSCLQSLTRWPDCGYGRRWAGITKGTKKIISYRRKHVIWGQKSHYKRTFNLLPVICDVFWGF